MNAEHRICLFLLFIFASVNLYAGQWLNTGYVKGYAVYAVSLMAVTWD